MNPAFVVIAAFVWLLAVLVLLVVGSGAFRKAPRPPLPGQIIRLGNRDYLMTKSGRLVRVRMKKEEQ